MEKNYIKLFEENFHLFNDFLDLPKMRKSAIKQFEQLGFPISKMEKWRDFNLKDFLSKYYYPSFKQEELDLQFLKYVPSYQDNDLFVLYNGFSSYEMQLEEYENGVIFGSIRSAFEKYPDLVKKYFNKANKDNLNGFNALNTAFCTDGFFLYVPENIKMEIPFSIVGFYKNHTNSMVSLRNIIILESNASASISQVETSDEKDNQFVNNLTEVYLADNASLEWDTLQKYRGNTIVINPVFSQQEENSNLKKTISTLRGHKLRNDIHCIFKGQYGNADINGLYITKGHDLIENRVFLDHAVPNCDSNQFFKGILDDKSRSSFTGYVLVRQDSQKTNAFQSNKNILISDDAIVNTNPFLEIYADDVKCSHGASVGNMDEKALFYIRSRGIDEKKARDILLSAFALEVLNNMKNENFKNLISSEIEKTLLHN